jgi:uncharacterized phiE125 gp8 family phage protein
MGLQIVTPPAAEPVTLENAKEFLSIEAADTTFDSLIDGFIGAAREQIEAVTGRSLAAQTYVLTLDEFSDAIELPRGPVTAVEWVRFIDLDGAAQTIADSDYTVDLSSDPQWIVRNSSAQWPRTLDAINVVSIRYTAGYAALPGPLRTAILLMVGDMFAFRETAAVGSAATRLPTSTQIDHLLANYRVWL